MVPKTVEHAVPNWLELADQQRFTERYPDVIDRQPASDEIFYVQIAGGLNTLGVFPEAVVDLFRR